MLKAFISLFRWLASIILKPLKGTNFVGYDIYACGIDILSIIFLLIWITVIPYIICKKDMNNQALKITLLIIFNPLVAIYCLLKKIV